MATESPMFMGMMRLGVPRYFLRMALVTSKMR